MQGENISLLSFGSHKERNYGTVSQRAYLGSALGKAKEVDLVEYAVFEDETLTGVAIKFSTSVEVLKRHNHFLCYDPELHAGKIIKVPINKGQKIESVSTPKTKALRENRNAEKRDNSVTDFFASIDSSINSGRNRLTNFNDDFINRLEE
ncbi:unnamed protein product [Oikopleura dioica]|uniref:LysM domain-containing protein n=1 Tax=Oikopleura dioica TaxID=34765 RepID=E4Z1A8_OIKDI|nr:unnamed protein product [Oikopleura dioica]